MPTVHAKHYICQTTNTAKQFECTIPSLKHMDDSIVWGNLSSTVREKLFMGKFGEEASFLAGHQSRATMELFTSKHIYVLEVSALIKGINSPENMW